MSDPWTEGPRELLQHAAVHLSTDGDFDRRIAMISVDNAVELTAKTYLGLPKRARGSDGPSRKVLEAASESFPALLNLLEEHAAGRLTGIELGDVEWYHRLRNQLYHSGNGITVDRATVEAYFQIALGLFENLFGVRLEVDESVATHTNTGEFMARWTEFDRGLRRVLPPKEGPAHYWQRDFMNETSPEAAALWESLVAFRNVLVHGPETPSVAEMDKRLGDLLRLMLLVRIGR